MILENKQEEDAFNFMYELLSEFTSRRVCNDLTMDEEDKFKGLAVPRDDNGKIIQCPIKYDFDVCYWLKEQIKKGEKQ